MALHRVPADADHQSIVLLDRLISVTEAAGFPGSAGGEVLQVEVERHVPTPEPLREVEGRTVVLRGLEVRGPGSWLEHG